MVVESNVKRRARVMEETLCLSVPAAVFARVVKIRSLLVNARTIENLESLQSGSRNFSPGQVC